MARSKPKIVVPVVRMTSKNSIPIEQAQIVYQNKCKDLKLKPNSFAEQRFIEQFVNSIHEKSLKMAGLGLGPSCMETLIEFIADNPNFVCIDLSLNRLGDTGIETLCRYLSMDGPIIDLDLRSNGVGIQGATMLFNAATLNTHLTHLDFSAIDGIERNRVGTEGCMALANMIRKNQTISSLNLAMCGITADGCRALGTALPYNSSLNILDLTANRFGTAGSDFLFAKKNAFGALTTLILSRNALDDDATNLLCQQIEESKTIKNLNLSCNNLGKNFLNTLYDALLNGQPPLESLNLSTNHFERDAIVYLHLLVRDFPSIKHFDFSHNNLTTKVINDIVIASEKNGNLTSLDLTETQINDEGAKSLAKMIEGHPSLTKLVLASNKITDDGGIYIAKALKNNKVLANLSLADNELKDKTAEELLLSLEKNFTIVDLDVSYNDFGCMAYVSLKRVIEEHKRAHNHNVHEIASKHIDFLKEQEQRLFETRDEIAVKEVSIVEARDTFEQRTYEMKELDIIKEQEINEAETKLAEVKEVYRVIADEQREKSRMHNVMKRELSEAEHSIHEQLTLLRQQKDVLENRCKIYEKNKNDQAIQFQKENDDLNMRLNMMKEQVKMAILDARDARKALLEKEMLEKLENGDENDKERKSSEKKQGGGKKGKKGKKGGKESSPKKESKKEKKKEKIQAKSSSKNSVKSSPSKDMDKDADKGVDQDKTTEKGKESSRTSSSSKDVTPKDSSKISHSPSVASSTTSQSSSILNPIEN